MRERDACDGSPFDRSPGAPRELNAWMRWLGSPWVGVDRRPTCVIALVDLRSEIAVVLSLPHHLLAVTVKRVVDDPLGGINRMIVLEAEMPEAFPEAFKARRFGLLIEAIVGVGAVDDLAQQRERGVIAQLVLLQERLE